MSGFARAIPFFGFATTFPGPVGLLIRFGWFPENGGTFGVLVRCSGFPGAATGGLGVLRLPLGASGFATPAIVLFGVFGVDRLPVGLIGLPTLPKVWFGAFVVRTTFVGTETLLIVWLTRGGDFPALPAPMGLPGLFGITLAPAFIRW